MIQTRLFVSFKGFAVQPGDIAISDQDGIDLPVLVDGNLLKARFSRLAVSIKIQGVDLARATAFIRQAEQAGLGTFYGSAPRETLYLNNREIKDAVLVRATASEPVQVGLGSIVESLELTYESTRYV